MHARAPRRLLALGGFDEGLFLYCEDTDLCLRLWQAGHTVNFEPAALVRHVGGASSGAGETQAIAARSRIYYARKHRGRVAARLEALGVALDEATHAAAALTRPGEPARPPEGAAGRRPPGLRTALMHVLYSFPTRLGTSGIGTTAWEQVAGLAEHGVDVTVVCGDLRAPAAARASS